MMMVNSKENWAKRPRESCLGEGHQANHFLPSPQSRTANISKLLMIWLEAAELCYTDLRPSGLSQTF